MLGGARCTTVDIVPDHHNSCLQMVGVKDENTVGNERFNASLFTEDYCLVCLPNPEAKPFHTKNTTGEIGN